MSEEAKKDVKSKDATNPYQVEVQLPSMGMFYGDALPDGKVTIRPVTVREEKLLAGKGDQMELADSVLEKCIVSKCLPIDELLMTDKFYLLLHLRAVSYGSDYAFRIQCPACERKFKHSIVLPKGLGLKVAEKGDKEPFEVELPMCKKKVTIRFLRGSDEKEIDSYISNIPDVSAEEGDPSYIFRLTRFIVDVDGKPMDAVGKMDFCSNLIGKDSLAIREAIAEHETGPILSIEAKCPGCQQKVHSVLPLTNEFFPSSVA